MLAPTWEDHDIETNPIINYFADRQHTELILRKIEQKIKMCCFYCHKCENCKKLFRHREVFKQYGFWTFNKHIKCWNVFDPDWCKRNKNFKHLKFPPPNHWPPTTAEYSINFEIIY